MARLAVGMAFMVGLVAGAAGPAHAASSTGEADQDTVVARDPVDDLVDCLAWQESRGDPQAYNPRSGAAGLLQFLLGTWYTTPQGRAGLSRYDPTAARLAARWMIAQGRLREWSTWRLCA
ncbi:MAG TPA: transglycosylase SLT domain-containing protein [Methylomirabilota bacterium]|nr:transglycosylase SLT domain-containing protein [Methylomirabilota bacterium]